MRKAAHTKEFRSRLQSLLRAPYDERPHHVLSVVPQPGHERQESKAPFTW